MFEFEGLDIAAHVLTELIKRGLDDREERHRELKKRCSDLRDACAAWTDLIESTFERVREQWLGLEWSEAARELAKLERNETLIDYGALQGGNFLNTLRRERHPAYEEMADACEAFYKEALHVKALLFEDIAIGDISVVEFQVAGERQRERRLDAYLQLLQSRMRTVQDANRRVALLP